MSRSWEPRPFYPGNANDLRRMNKFCSELEAVDYAGDLPIFRQARHQKHALTFVFRRNDTFLAAAVMQPTGQAVELVTWEALPGRYNNAEQSLLRHVISSYEGSYRRVECIVPESRDDHWSLLRSLGFRGIRVVPRAFYDGTTDGWVFRYSYRTPNALIPPSLTGGSIFAEEG